jgi:predicted nucleic acid-binding protein
MNDKPFFDTNVLVYSIIEEDPRKLRARELLAAGGVISAQVLNEFVSVVRRKVRMPWHDVRTGLQWFRILCRNPVPLTIETHQEGVRIAEQYGYGIYDSLIVASALEAKCDVIYSEDFQDRQVIEARLMIRNPFTSRP